MQNLSLVEKIKKLKEKRKAIILVHNYQLPEIQDIADYLGDSLGLSQKAAQTDADVIVFCGVHFMAETASILCPDKTVLMPDINAGCPMADMIDAEKLRRLKKVHPAALVISYVNTTADVKAESNLCCTSANAVKIINSLDTKKIIFVPDKYLGHYVATKTNKELIFWEGYCPIHVKILADDILKARKEHPEAEVIVHPECTPEVIKLANKVLSTSGMCRYAKESKTKEIIVGTEVGLIYRLQKENPDKIFYPATELAICPNMKLNNLEKVLWTLEDMKFKVKVKEEIRIKAKNAIDKMLQFSRID
ncbi:MAG: quinolinate synthase [Armatimonadetes bacterium CG07_land_8_20_14_0_80_40_9]|nr:MAG: quinolinate synthase [Armatimonadetes bacterium CG07_land_8_20_14_0_80_40_9]